MKKTFLLLCALTISLGVFAQEKVQIRKGFSIGTNFTFVTNKIWNTTDESIGIYGEYELPLIKGIGLSGLATVGLDKMLGCDLCESGWFKQGYWWGFGLKRPFQVKNQVFSFQARGRWFGFDRYEPTSIDSEGNFTDWRDLKDVALVFGIKATYKIPINVPVEISYALESNATFQLNTVSLSWNF